MGPLIILLKCQVRNKWIFMACGHTHDGHHTWGAVCQCTSRWTRDTRDYSFTGWRILPRFPSYRCSSAAKVLEYRSAVWNHCCRILRSTSSRTAQHQESINVNIVMIWTHRSVYVCVVISAVSVRSHSADVDNTDQTQYDTTSLSGLKCSHGPRFKIC